MARAIVTQGELHLIGQVVNAHLHSTYINADGQEIPLYATERPLLSAQGHGPVMFPSNHLSFLPPEQMVNEFDYGSGLITVRVSDVLSNLDSSSTIFGSNNGNFL